VSRVISVVIPVKDGGSELVRCLDAITSQTIDSEVEIVVVDSGSTDASVATARDFGAVVREIPPREFSHGRARNLGAALARGDVLVFISQDAYPLEATWLERLTSPLHEDSTLAGVYGRQLPHEGATPPERYFLGFLYGEKQRRQEAASVGELTMETTLFSNVNAAMPRALWQRFPFVEDIIMSEDQDWCRRVLLAGYAVRYEPKAVVWHSHNYTLGAAFRRFFDSGASADRAYLAGDREAARALRAAALRYARGELAWLWRSGRRRWIPYAAVYETTKFAGLVLGANHARIPLPVKRHLSALPSFWQ